MRKYSLITKASSRRAWQTKRIKYSLTLFGVLIALWFLVPSLVGGVAALAVQPILAIGQWFEQSQSSLPSYIRARAALEEEISDLKEKVAAQSGLQLGIDRLRNENESLRALLGARPSSSRLVAGVLAMPPQTPYDTLVIDRGSSDGVAVSMPVFVGLDQVVGLVSTVYQHSAVVQLASSPGVRSTAYIVGPNIYTTAVGMGGGVLRVGVPQGIDLSVGNMVLLPVLDGGVYGTISHVESEPSQPEQFGYIPLEAPLHEYRLVSVGLTSLETPDFETIRESVAATRANILEADLPEGILVDVVATTTNATTTNATTTTSTLPIQRNQTES